MSTRWQIRTDLRRLAGEACSDGPLVIAAGAGKGGVGTSLVLANLGLFLAQLGKRILVVDLARGGGNVHSMVGHTGQPPAEEPGPDAQVDRFIETTPISGLDVIPGRPGDRRRPPRLGWKRWYSTVGEMRSRYDGFFFDCGAWPRREELDLFVHAGACFVVIVPEPTSVDSTMGFLQEATRRHLAHEPALGPRVRKILAADRRAPPTPAEVLDRVADADEAAAGALARHLERFRPGLVVNQARVRTDFDLGPAVESVARRVLGIPLTFLGSIEADDAIWKSVRHGRPLLVDAPTSKPAKEIERIARRVLAPESAARAAGARVREPARQENFYEALEVDPGTTEEEVRRAYRRLREVYSGTHIATQGHVGPAELRRIRARIDEAYETLTDVSLRRPYDLALKDAAGQAARGPQPPPRATTSEAGPPGDRAPRSRESDPPIAEGTEFTGAFLRDVRRRRGIEREAVARLTKIGSTYLRAIEEEDYAALPEEVFLRGYLRHVARTLGLPERDVAESYLRRYRAGRRRPGRRR